MTRSTTSATGLAVSFDTPPVTDGQGSVTVSCSPQSGETFPIGTTSVTCKATDTLNRSAECSFNVTVTKLSTLARQRYLAFGDSITAGEVTFPVAGLFGGPSTFSKQVLVPIAAYPTVLAKTLQARFPSQADFITVANYGVSGEKAINARDRFFAALNIVKPEVVLFLHGHNDIPGGLDGAASGAARELQIMAAEARLRGMRVFIANAVPPRPNGNRTIGQLFIDDWNGRMRDLAFRENAVFVDIYNALRTDVNRYIGVDGLHPTEAGYAKIADTFLQHILTNFEVR